MSQSATSRVTVPNRLGLHARPAMDFVQCASGFEATIQVKRVDGDEVVDGKSIMQMMLLAATVGTELEIICDGSDADVACIALVELVNGGFGES